MLKYPGIQLFFLINLSLGWISLTAQAPDANLLLWSQSSRLNLNDFRQSAPEMDTSYSIGRGRTIVLEGYIHTGIQFNYEGVNNKITFSAQAFMDPSKSWIKSRTDSSTLAHEQAHFDITEIYTRKFKRELQNVKNTNAAKKLYTRIFNELKVEQQRFDNYHKGETGVDPYWAKKILLQLDELKAFELKSIETTIR